eukprot:11092486-Alexandrium_andersonii.AAC.1
MARGCLLLRRSLRLGEADQGRISDLPDFLLGFLQFTRVCACMCMRVRASIVGVGCIVSEQSEQSLSSA